MTVCTIQRMSTTSSNTSRRTSSRAAANLDVRLGRKAQVATTRLAGSDWSSARSYLCNGDAGDREQATDNQLGGHAVAKEQHARNQGEHWQQQAERCDA